MIKTIAHFIAEDIKIHQGYIYNQMERITDYRSIIIGTFDNCNSVYPLNRYFNLYQIADLETFFYEQNILAVHVHHGKHVETIMPICKQYHIPLIVSIRGRDGSAQRDSFVRNLNRYKELIHFGTLFLPVCHYLADEMKQIGFPSERTKVLYGGIDLELFTYCNRVMPPLTEEIRLVSVGRLVEKKGFDTLIQAFQQVHGQYPTATLHIIGAGPNKESIEKLINDLQLQQCVFLRGVMNAKQVSEELRQAHLFVLASQTAEDGDVEGIPNVLKEAMASGLPVVSTRHAGIPELIEHLVSGFLAPERDVATFAEGILFFLENQQQWDSFTLHARAVIEEKFNLEKQLVEQQSMYAMLESKAKLL